MILILVLFGTSRVLAQEMNYNTFQVGSRSALMGGAVVGGVRDTSATFYNPGPSVLSRTRAFPSPPMLFVLAR